MKLFGALICFAVSLAYGISAGKRERARTAECQAFLSLFSHIQNQIGYFYAPTKEIYQGLQNDVLARVGFLEALVSHEDDAVYFDVWRTALAHCRPRLHLSKTQFDIVEAFGSCIGKSNGELQLRHLEYYRKELSAETEKQVAQMKKNIKVYRTLGFAVGAAAVILAL